MAFSFLPELVISIVVVHVVIVGFYYIKSSKNPLLPVSWPVVGILPSLVVNLHRLHHYISFDLLTPSGHSLKVAIASIRMFITCDPTNIQYIFSSNHTNYPKGEDYAEIFDMTRGSLFSADGESSRRERANFQSVLSNPLLVGLMTKCCHDKVEKSLLPFMAHMVRTNTHVDMNDMLMRLVFDLYATTIFSVDPTCLSLDMPSVHVANAMDTVMEVGFVRHIVPAFFWKVMRRLNIGPERKLAAAQAVLRCFIMDMITERRKKGHIIGQEVHIDVLSNYVNDQNYNDDLLQATLITYMIAGRDTIGTTLPWVVYNLTKNPHIVSSIRTELAPIMSRKAAIAGAVTMMTFEPEEVRPLVYLQATLLETLRLYPPIPIERRSVVSTDVMPSGHPVCAQDIILVSIYSVGRMESVWGSDCLEYRPERWLSDDGRQLRYVPSNKFPAFNSGARLCLGKDIAIMQMKIIIAAIVCNFDVKMVDGQAIDTKLSCLLQMKNGLKVNLSKVQM
ncbi:noroxomaritidine synthase 2 [Aegilops tauschii subsp. strangulata]|uniref:Cytochrome P450 86A1 n=1 Tax=Aegilops tauschii TaxID=37682 RepID=R7WDD7_AEGTA|nr:noroxomaritidine synthase 2 [Aegilops tauschii subsp. strangulata]